MSVLNLIYKVSLFQWNIDVAYEFYLKLFIDQSGHSISSLHYEI